MPHSQLSIYTMPYSQLSTYTMPYSQLSTYTMPYSQRSTYTMPYSQLSTPPVPTRCPDLVATCTCITGAHTRRQTDIWGQDTAAVRPPAVAARGGHTAIHSPRRTYVAPLMMISIHTQHTRPGGGGEGVLARPATLPAVQWNHTPLHVTPGLRSESACKYSPLSLASSTGWTRAGRQNQNNRRVCSE